MRRIQNPDVAQALKRQFGLRGGISIEMDEMLVPVQDGGDFAGSSPFVERRRTMDAFQCPAAGAGTYSFGMVTPGVGMLLVIEELYVYANGQITLWSLMRPVDIATVTVTASSTMANLSGPLLKASGFYPQVAAQSHYGHHTTTTIGAAIFQEYGASPTRKYPFKRGILLDGRDPGGVGGIAIFNSIVNAELRFGAVMTEYVPSG